MSEIIFNPIGNRVVVRPDQAENSVGGILMPETSVEAPQSGTIIAVGPGTKEYSMQTKEGDKAYFSKYGNAEIPLNGEKLLIISEPDLYGFIRTES